MGADKRIMTDAEVAAMLGISTRTLRRRVRQPAKGEIDLTRAEPQTIGGRRFWVRAKVERLVGL